MECRFWYNGQWGSCIQFHSHLYIVNLYINEIRFLLFINSVQGMENIFLSFWVAFLFEQVLNYIPSLSIPCFGVTYSIYVSHTTTIVAFSWLNQQLTGCLVDSLSTMVALYVTCLVHGMGFCCMSLNLSAVPGVVLWPLHWISICCCPRLSCPEQFLGHLLSLASSLGVDMAHLDIIYSTTETVLKHFIERIFETAMYC